MAGTRTRLAALNVVTNLLLTALTLATGLLATPWLIEWLGKDRFGDSRMMVELFGYLALIELGLGGGLGPILARALGRGDSLALRRTLSAGLGIYAATTCVIFAVGLVLVGAITWLVPVPPSLVGDLRLAAIVTLLGFTSLVFSPFRALAEAQQRGYWVNMLLSGQSVIITGTALLLAYRGWGITGQAAATALGTILVSLALAGEAWRRHPGLVGGALTTKPDRESVGSLGKLSMQVMVMHLSGRLSLMTDAYIVGRILGPAAISSLIATQRLAQIIQGQLQGLGNATWAPLAELHARGENEAFNRKLVELTGLVALFGAATLSPILAYDRVFVTLWMRGRNVPYGGDVLIGAACAIAILHSLFSLWCWCFSGTGRLERVAPMMFLSSLINVAASITLTLWVGLPGPLLGTLVAFMAINIWFLPLQLRSVFGTSLRELGIAVARPLALGLVHGAVFWWVARLQTSIGWISLAIQTGVACLSYLVLAWCFLIDDDSRKLWQLRLAGILARRDSRDLSRSSNGSVGAAVVAESAGDEELVL
jgi:O-antigen/teichoic acid export membrane protein